MSTHHCECGQPCWLCGHALAAFLMQQHLARDEDDAEQDGDIDPSTSGTRRLLGFTHRSKVVPFWDYVIGFYI